MIKKEGSQYVIRSHTTGRKLGSYSSKAAAAARLRQIEYFKHAKDKK